MNFVQDEIYVIKLVTGEEVVAKVKEVTDTAIGLQKPASIGMSPQGGLQMVPMIFTANPEKGMWVNTSAIVAVAEPRKEVRDSYIEGTTGIKPVTQSIIMG